MAQLEDVEFAVLEWVSWYNNRRLLEPIGYIPPVEHEERTIVVNRFRPKWLEARHELSGKTGAVQQCT